MSQIFNIAELLVSALKHLIERNITNIVLDTTTLHENYDNNDNSS